MVFAVQFDGLGVRMNVGGIGLLVSVHEVAGHVSWGDSLRRSMCARSAPSVGSVSSRGEDAA
jgi:hypothetical protein